MCGPIAERSTSSACSVHIVREPCDGQTLAFKSKSESASALNCTRSSSAATSGSISSRPPKNKSRCWKAGSEKNKRCLCSGRTRPLNGHLHHTAGNECAIRTENPQCSAAVSRGSRGDTMAAARKLVDGIRTVTRVPAGSWRSTCTSLGRPRYSHYPWPALGSRSETTHSRHKQPSPTRVMSRVQWVQKPNTAQVRVHRKGSLAKVKRTLEVLQQSSH